MSFKVKAGSDAQSPFLEETIKGCKVVGGSLLYVLRIKVCAILLRYEDIAWLWRATLPLATHLSFMGTGSNAFRMLTLRHSCFIASNGS